MSQFAKPIEELLKAEFEHKHAMESFTDYFSAANELRTDIAERFPYPSLWAAMDRLIDFTGQRERAYATLKAAGYTTDDAFAFALHERDSHEQ